jgi:CRP-like cAMP-binding protein
MRGPYGFELSESCRDRKFRRNGFFCQLSADELKDFDAVKHVSAYPAGAILFVEQQRSRGIYLLCEGQVKLSFSSSGGRTLVLRIGEVLGLLSALSDNPYEVTAETLRPCQTAFVYSNDFQKFLRKHNRFPACGYPPRLGIQGCVRTIAYGWPGVSRIRKSGQVPVELVRSRKGIPTRNAKPQ